MRFFISFSQLIYRICIISVLQTRKLRFTETGFLSKITQPTTKERGPDRRAVRLALKAAIFLFCSLKELKCILVELFQMFPTEISFPLLGVDISDLSSLVPWQGHCEEVSTLLPLLLGRRCRSWSAAPCQPPAWPHSSMVLTSLPAHSPLWALPWRP